MEIPKDLIPKRKDLGEKMEQLLKGAKTVGHNPKIVEYLLDSCCEFLEDYKKSLQDRRADIDFKAAYRLGKKLAKEMKYTKYDLEELVQKLGTEEKLWKLQAGKGKYLGFYLSALVNKIITKNDNIILEGYVNLIGLGSHLERGTVTIRGDVSNYAGAFMKGGELIVKGWVGNFIGIGMKGGRITVKGGIQANYIGLDMTGGEIIKTV